MQRVNAVDKFNAMFELFGAVAVLPSIWAAAKAKRVVGVSAVTSVFFVAWGLWNIIYYPALGQTWSGYAAIAMTTTNMIYLYQILIYSGDEVKA